MNRKIQMDKSFNDLMFPPLRTIKIHSDTKHQLSQQCRDNFLQFLMIQKAGKPGDMQFLERLKSKYSKEFKARIVPISKKNIQYLNAHDENDKIIQKQTNFILSGRFIRESTPLDVFIKKRGQVSLHQSKSVTNYKIDRFNI